MSAGCGKKMQEYIPRGYGYKEITVKCGSTSPSGYPWQCEKCEKLNEHRDWHREAAENGECWGEDDY